MSDPDIQPIQPGNPAEQQLGDAVRAHLQRRAEIVLPEPDPEMVDKLRKGEPL